MLIWLPRRHEPADLLSLSQIKHNVSVKVKSLTFCVLCCAAQLCLESGGVCQPPTSEDVFVTQHGQAEFVELAECQAWLSGSRAFCANHGGWWHEVKRQPTQTPAAGRHVWLLCEIKEVLKKGDNQGNVASKLPSSQPRDLLWHEPSALDLWGVGGKPFRGCGIWDHGFDLHCGLEIRRLGPHLDLPSSIPEPLIWCCRCVLLGAGRWGRGFRWSYWRV